MDVPSSHVSLPSRWRMKYTNAILTLVVLYMLYVDALGLNQIRNGTVYKKKDGKFVFKEGIDKTGGLAYGTYDESYLTTGWDVLDIKAGYGGQKQPPKDVMHAGGFMEGYMSAKKIGQHWRNNLGMSKKVEWEWEEMRKLLAEQERWTKERIATDGGRTPFWRQISYILARLDGLVDGYQAAVEDKGLMEMSRFEFMYLNAVADGGSLFAAENVSRRLDFDKLTDKEFQYTLNGIGHCSVLIRVTPGFENIFMGHATWYLYWGMLRIYKHYDFNVDDPAYLNKQFSMSSYPGMISSLDDFYLMSNGLAVLETTNIFFNNSLYDLVKPQSLLTYQRVLAANAMAKGGKEWAEIFKTEASGTYPNQYMVVDLKKIIPNKEIKKDALWVIEEIPGLVVAEDQTKILRQGYWASYNIAFYEEIVKRSMYPHILKTRGQRYGHELYSRAKIFRRDSGKVNDLQSLKDILRYNDYKNDPYSEGDACSTICCRGDLTPLHAPIGCTDAKVTDFNLAWKRESLAINGPTTGTNRALEPFTFANISQPIRHEGLAETFDFDWVKMRPNGL